MNVKNKPTPKIGDVLYSLNVGNATRHCEQVLTPVIVTKIGRKYFSCRGEKQSDWQKATEYYIEDWVEKNNISPNSKLYSTPQECEEETEPFVIQKEIRDAFQYGANSHKVTVKDLRVIKAILDKYKL